MDTIDIKTNTPELNHPYWMALLTQQIEEEYSLFALKIMVSFTIKDFNNGKIKAPEAISNLIKLYKQNPQYIPNLERNIKAAENTPNIKVNLDQNSQKQKSDESSKNIISHQKKNEKWLSGLLNFFKSKRK